MKVQTFVLVHQSCPGMGFPMFCKTFANANDNSEVEITSVF